MRSISSSQEMCCDDVIKYIYNLNLLDIKVYKKLCTTKELRANELAKMINKERSTVYRSLQRLCKCELCKKKTNTIEQGGYYHTYIAVDKKYIKKDLEKCIKEWSQKMKKTLGEL